MSGQDPAGVTPPARSEHGAVSTVNLTRFRDEQPGVQAGVLMPSSLVQERQWAGLDAPGRTNETRTETGADPVASARPRVTALTRRGLRPSYELAGPALVRH
jgi:hypothetical protein